MTERMTIEAAAFENPGGNAAPDDPSVPVTLHHHRGLERTHGRSKDLPTRLC